jgi:hypothetical protein
MATKTGVMGFLSDGVGKPMPKGEERSLINNLIDGSLVIPDMDVLEAAADSLVLKSFGTLNSILDERDSDVVPLEMRVRATTTIGQLAKYVEAKRVSKKAEKTKQIDTDLEILKGDGNEKS